MIGYTYKKIYQHNNKMFIGTVDKKLSYRRGTARCVVSVEIVPIATHQCKKDWYDNF